MDLKLLVNEVYIIDKCLRQEVKYSLLSSEGRFICEMIVNFNHECLKDIYINESFSQRTAFNSIKKLEQYGLLKKTIHTSDARRTVLDFDIEKLNNIINNNRVINI